MVLLREIQLRLTGPRRKRRCIARRRPPPRTEALQWHLCRRGPIGSVSMGQKTFTWTRVHGRPIPLPSVTDGQHAAGNVVPLAKGTTLTVQVNDPQKFLQARTGDPGPGHIFLALLPPKSAPIPIPLVQSDATTMKQQIVIPPDTSFQVLV